MAEEKHEAENPMSIVYFVIGGVAILLAFWYFSGGPERSDLRGIFLKPPPPIGTGESYGPTIPNSTSTNNR